MNRRLALLVAAAFFMENLDGTIIQTAVPTIARDFGVGALQVTASITAYLLAVAIGVPASGWLANRFGTRRVFLAAVTLFTLASVACALSQDLPELVAARVAQGIGGAMMVPIGRLAVLRAVDKRDLLSAIAYLTWPALAAPLVAPALGGILTDTVGWHWIFLINLPIGLACLVAGLRLLSRGDMLARTPFDWPGFLLTGASLAALVLAMQEVTAPRVSWWLAGALFATAVGVGWAAVAWLRRATHPLLSFAALRTHTFRVANAGGGLYRMLVSSAPLLFTLLFQVAFGWSATIAGLLVVALFAGNLLIKPLTTPIIRRFGFRTAILASDIGGGAVFALAALLDRTTAVWVIVGLLVVSGALRSIGFTAYQSVQFADIDSDATVDANSLSSTVQQVAVAVGIAFAAVVVRASTTVAVLSAGPSDGWLGYRWAFLVLAALMIVPAIEAARLRRDAGSHLVAA
jgi:EmrB/QacA subfamily drug resistance transporter